MKITEEKLEHIFYNAIVILPKNDSSVFLGSLLPTDAPDGLNAVMKHYTAYIDGLLQSLPFTDLQRIEVSMLRSFTFDEYKCLFVITIKEQEFTHYPIFRTLLITSNKERMLFIRSHLDTYEAYLAFLESWTKIHNTFLHAFLYETRIDSTNF